MSDPESKNSPDQQVQPPSQLHAGAQLPPLFGQVITSPLGDMSESVGIESFQHEVVSHEMSMSSGPTPPAAELESLHRLDPSYADRVLKMSEKEQLHRHEMMAREQQNVFEIAKSDQQIKKRGQVAAVIVATLCIVGAVVAALYGQTTFAIALGGGTVVSLATIFILGRSRETASGHTRQVSEQDGSPPQVIDSGTR